MNFVRLLRNGIQLGFTEEEIAGMSMSKYIRLINDIEEERQEIEAKRKEAEEQAEIAKLASYD